MGDTYPTHFSGAAVKERRLGSLRADDDRAGACRTAGIFEGAAGLGEATQMTGFLRGLCWAECPESGGSGRFMPALIGTMSWR